MVTTRSHTRKTDSENSSSPSTSTPSPLTTATRTKSQRDDLSTLQRTNSGSRFGNSQSGNNNNNPNGQKDTTKSTRAMIQHQSRILSAENTNQNDNSGDEEDSYSETAALLPHNAKTKTTPSSSSSSTTSLREKDIIDDAIADSDDQDPNTYKQIQTRDDETELMDVLGVGKSTQSIWSDLRGDYINVLILTLLYILQGLPMGLSQTIPLVMAERKAGFAAQAVFSLVTMPFSLKLLWAPFVDTYYCVPFGKRKTWILPTQVLCGFCLLYFSSSINFWISGNDGGDIDTTPNVDVFSLSTFFIFLYFLMATQDIAVDAWALSMLRSRNVVWAGTINNIGQYVGVYLTNISYLLFSSPTFCSKYLWFLLPVALNKDTGVVEVVPQGLLDITLLMRICGVLFIFTTTIIILFKNETDVHVYDYVADLFWQLQERKRMCGVLTTPLSITVDTEKSKSNPKNKSDGNNDDNITNQIPKRLYPHPLKDENSVGEMTKLSKQLMTITKPQNNNNTKNTTNLKIPLTNHNGTVNYENIPADIISIVSTERRYLAPAEDDDNSEGLVHTLKRMKSIMTLPNVQKLVFWLLTFRIAVAACDVLTELKLFSRGLQKEQLAYMTTFSAPLTFMVPIFLTSLVSTYKRPFAISVASLVPRILLCFAWVTFVAVFPTMLYYEQTTMIFAILFILTLFQHFIGLTQMVCGMTFFALVAKNSPKIAASLITGLHTAANLGAMSIKILAMSMVDAFTVNICVSSEFNAMPQKMNNGDGTDLAAEATMVKQQLNDKSWIKMLTHIKKSTTNAGDNVNNNTDSHPDIDQQYHDYLLDNLKIITNNDGTSTTEETDPTAATTSPFIQTLLKQPIQHQRTIVNEVYTNDLSKTNSALYYLAHGFLEKVKSIGEKIGLLSAKSSELFFNQIYLLPYQAQTPAGASALGQHFTPLSTCTPIIQPNYKELLRDSKIVQNWGNYDQVIADINKPLSQSPSDTTPSHSASHFLSQALLTTHDHHKAGNMCEAIGGKCVPIVDGYFVEVIVCGIFGLFYFAFVWPRLKGLDLAPPSAWKPVSVTATINN